MQMSSSFEVLQFGLAMKASKKRSQAKEHEISQQDKQVRARFLIYKIYKLIFNINQMEPSKKRSKTKKTNKTPKSSQSAEDDDFQRVFMDNHASSGFFNHSF
jgi:hypothetical protein